jgi:hypothetical protein
MRVLLGLLGAINGKNGGSDCYTCMVIGSWVDQYTRGNGMTDYKLGLAEICPMLGLIEPFCEEIWVL